MKTIHSCVQILSDEEISQIHETTKKVLWEVGCRLPHPRIQSMFQARGARVDAGSGIVFIPPDLVEEALAGVKKYGPPHAQERAAGQAAPIRFHNFRVGPGNQANMIDYQASSRRLGTVEDVIRGIVLCNELPHIGWTMPLVTPADVPGFLGDVYGYYLCALYSRKPFGVYILSPGAARDIIRIWDLIKDIPGRFVSRPDISYLLEPNGSLSYDRYSLEMCLVFADAGYPFNPGPMTMAGLDGPVTLAGTLVLQNAVNLVSVVMAYLMGAAGAWGGSAHTLDLRTMLCSFGSPNQVLLGFGAIQLGNFYGFDVGVNSGLTDACLPDFQSGFEKGMTSIAALLGGAAHIGAQAIVGADQGTSLEQLVIDDEWASALDHIFSRGLEVNEDTLALEVIRQVGVGGSYLAEEHTRKHMRSTYWKANLFNQASWDAWYSDGGKDVYAKAHDKVEAILRRCYPPQPLVDPTTHAALDAILAEASAHPERYAL